MSFNFTAAVILEPKKIKSVTVRALHTGWRDSDLQEQEEAISRETEQ